MPQWAEKWDVQGSRGNVYVVSRDQDGNFGCSCPVWKFKRESCKHIAEIRDRIATADIKGPVVRKAMPGNVGEVTIDGDVALYPLMPLPANVYLVYTIIYDLLRAGVSMERVVQYRNDMFKDKYPIKDILFHVKTVGRFIFKTFVLGKGWTDAQRVPNDTPLKNLGETEDGLKVRQAIQQAQDMINAPVWF